MATISVIIPVWREASAINETIRAIRGIDGGAATEIIVVDGEAEGGTLAAIEDTAVTKLLSPKGRGRQQNRGAGAAHGDVLLFVHADTLLPPAALARIAEVMADASCAGGAFDLAIESPRPAFRVIERVASLRSRATKIPYGDQAIFLRASRFRMLGGFREIPLMEDVELMQRVKRRGWKIAIVPEPVLTSPRRWEKEGVLYGTLRNWCLVTLFYCGVSPERLARFYR